MKRIWKAILAATISLGAATVSFNCAGMSPAQMITMMERTRPGFLVSFIGGAV
jgi:hypothetical protein